MREQYPSRNPRRSDREPTAAEVEAMVAEQLKCLPDWWPADGVRDVDPDGD